MVAPVCVGEEGLGALRHPFHRPADFARRPQADETRRVSGKMQHFCGEAAEAQDGSRGERLHALERSRHAQGVLPVDLDVLEQVRGRAQARQIRCVQIQALSRAVAAGELVVIAGMRIDRRARCLLGGARVPVMVDVAMADEDPPDVPERESELAESGEQRIAPFPGTDARVEEGDAAALLLDRVHVGRPARLRKWNRNRDPLNPETGERGRHPLSFLTSSVSSGSALNRSPTSP